MSSSVGAWGGRILILVLPCGIALGGPSIEGGRTILFVDQNATGSVHDGWTWCSAFTDLQDAMDLAVWNVTIRVADGTYKPDRGTGARGWKFVMKSNVWLEGGYAGCGAIDPHERDIAEYETTLSGDLDDNDVGGLDHASRDENSYNILSANAVDRTASLDGFTITRGNSSSSGGGLHMGSGDPTISNCLFEANTADEEGGAVYIGNNGRPLLNNCTFVGNAAGLNGGAIYSYHNGNPVANNCIFQQNTADSNGGAIFSQSSSFRLSGCMFTGNHAMDGGAVHGTFILSRCAFLGNTANRYGGAIDGGGSITSSLFSGNTANNNGGAIFGGGGSTITNCTFAANFSPITRGISVSGSGSANVISSILWNGGDEVGTGVLISYSNVQGGWPGVGNFFALPEFVDPDGADDLTGTEDDDLRLLPESPCVDAGDPNYAPDPEDTDLAGNPRLVDGNGDSDPIVDMGAYELPADCEGNDFDEDGVADVCDPDIDDDGVLNFTDVCDFTGPGAAVDSNGRPQGDVNLDCNTDLQDFAALQNGWTGPLDRSGN